MPREKKKLKELKVKLGAAEKLLVPEPVVEPVWLPEPEVAQAELAAILNEPEDLLATLVCNKLFYGKKVVSCQDMGFLKLVDEQGSVFTKTREELKEILK